MTIVTVPCVVRDYNASNDTCSVELQGVGVIETWIDGMAIDPSISRAKLASGVAGVVTMSDVHRLCGAVLTSITVNPATTASIGASISKTYNGRVQVSMGAGGSGSVNVTFPAAFTAAPNVTAQGDGFSAPTLSAITTTGFTATITGPVNGYANLTWTATGY